MSIESDASVKASTEELVDKCLRFAAGRELLTISIMTPLAPLVVAILYGLIDADGSGLLEFIVLVMWLSSVSTFIACVLAVGRVRNLREIIHSEFRSAYSDCVASALQDACGDINRKLGEVSKPRAWVK